MLSPAPVSHWETAATWASVGANCWSYWAVVRNCPYCELDGSLTAFARLASCAELLGASQTRASTCCPLGTVPVLVTAGTQLGRLPTSVVLDAGLLAPAAPTTITATTNMPMTAAAIRRRRTLIDAPLPSVDSAKCREDPEPSGPILQRGSARFATQAGKAATVRAGRLAQLGEHLPYKQGVAGSSPAPPIT